jgi:hypothetical protein
MTTNLETLALDPDAVAESLAGRLHKLSADATSSELIYTPSAPLSYYRDLLAMHGKGTSPGHEQRLTRHAEQMATVGKLREQRARRALSAGGFEYRVEPNRTDGQGGYFSPPLWWNEMFATANRPGRVLADLIRARFPLPRGVSSINLPVIGTGSVIGSEADVAAVPSSDITDSPGVSPVPTFAGFVDVALQLLEQSPPGAHIDWAIFSDLTEATDAQLETQLLVGNGTGVTSLQLIGVTNVSGSNAVTYTDASPTGSEMYPFFGNAAAKIGDIRLRPPECWLMRTARWAWLQTQEDTATLPFGLYSPYYLGNTDDTPDPIGALLGWPVFLSDAIPANLSGNPGAFVAGGGTQDLIVCLRPSDLILLESEPQTLVTREPLSGSLGARIEQHSYAAAITDRRPASVSVLGGTGLTVQSGE